MHGGRDGTRADHERDVAERKRLDKIREWAVFGLPNHMRWPEVRGRSREAEYPLLASRGMFCCGGRNRRSSGGPPRPAQSSSPLRVRGASGAG